LSQVDKFEILVSQLQAYCLNPSSPGFIHCNCTVGVSRPAPPEYFNMKHKRIIFQGSCIASFPI
jgi:hypothetical protein